MLFNPLQILLLWGFATTGSASNTFTRKATPSSLLKTATPSVSPTAVANAAVVDCFLKVPANALTANGLAQPFVLQPPCSMNVATQQAFVEAAVYDPATGSLSVYHPLVVSQGKQPPVAPVTPNLPAGAVVALWFGFNGNTLQLLDSNGLDANTSPILKGMNCVNGLPGTKGDVFGQVSWCNTQPFFQAANAGVSSGKLVVPDLGLDKNGQTCPSSRSFKLVDQDQSDNIPTQYLLLQDGSTIQDTAANRKANPGATIISNASDEGLLANILDPAIGCTPFLVPSLDDTGAMIASLASDEIQASVKQQAPIAIVPMADPDCLLTSSGQQSTQKTNAYRLGVNQPLLGQGDNGALAPYCNNLVSIAPPFFKGFQTTFTNTQTPDAGTGNNLFTFLCNRYLMSLTNLNCPNANNQPIKCTFDGNGAATACTITLAGNTTTGAGTGAVSSQGAVASASTTSVKGAKAAASSSPAAGAPASGGVTQQSASKATTAATSTAKQGKGKGAAGAGPSPSALSQATNPSAAGASQAAASAPTTSSVVAQSTSNAATAATTAAPAGKQRKGKGAAGAGPSPSTLVMATRPSAAMAVVSNSVPLVSATNVVPVASASSVGTKCKIRKYNKRNL